jgi:hypothetical protein
MEIGCFIQIKKEIIAKTQKNNGTYTMDSQWCY